MISPLFFLSFDLCVCGVGGGGWGVGGGVGGGGIGRLFCLFNLSCVNFVLFIEPQLRQFCNVYSTSVAYRCDLPFFF